jgi:hypothetical protein
MKIAKERSKILRFFETYGLEAAINAFNVSERTLLTLAEIKNAA